MRSAFENVLTSTTQDSSFSRAEADPLHLFLEEAHDYLPQQVGGAQANLVHVWQDIVRWGRFKGLGCTMASQRSAALNKDVLNQAEALIAMRVLAKLDRDAIKGWVEYHGQASEILSTLSQLGAGEGWVWAPALLGDPRRVQFRQRWTFDSAATPKVGQKRRQPATLADVDLGAVKEAMAETIEKAKESDPMELRRRITELEQRLRVAQSAAPEPVPVLDETSIGRLVALVELADEVHALREDVAGVLERWPRDRSDVPGAGQSGDRARAVASGPAERSAQRADPSRRRDAGGAAVPGSAEPDELPAGPAGLLRVLVARYPAWLTRRQVITLAKRGPKSSALDGHFAQLLDRGLIERDGTGVYAATKAGLAAANGEPPEDPVEAWHAAFTGATQKVFDALVQVYPERYTRDGVADLAGLSRTSSSVGQALTNLRRNGLIEEHDGGIQLADLLFEGRS
jgi:hypothetical protein